MEPIVGMDYPFGYRNKAQFPVGVNAKGEIVTGFYAGRTHTIIANTNCALGAAVNEKILQNVLTYMKETNTSAYDEKTGKGLVRHILTVSYTHLDVYKRQPKKRSNNQKDTGAERKYGFCNFTNILYR